MSAQKQYIGDSVYADFDGSYIILTTENDPSGPSNTICLEGEVFRAFLLWAKNMGMSLDVD